MGWRFRKSFKIAPGIRLNIGKKGISSLSIGPRGAHINVGKNGTSLSTGIPGTGLYNVARLDQPAGKSMTQCPYCGHKMRKQWDACPKCHGVLIQKVAPPPRDEPINITPPKEADTDPPIIDVTSTPVNNTPPTKKKGYATGCGCLVIIIVLMMIGSFFGGGHNKTPAASSSAPAAVTTSSSSGSSSSADSSTPAATPAPATASPSPGPAAAPPKSDAPTEKKYYGNGPNGEGIKGHIDNKKGTKIYHIPGSTYYGRTTHVSQWFFTEREAREAGYRAPYR